MHTAPDHLAIRAATIGDAPAIQAIYAPYVTNTQVSFEEIAPDTDEIARRIESISADYPFLVAVRDGSVIGYAYASQHRTRPAYRTSVDVAVYVSPEAQRQGVGRALFDRLLPAAKTRGYHAAFAGIVLPNAASIGLHEAVGFRYLGTYHQVGRKFDRWLDVGWWQRVL